MERDGQGGTKMTVTPAMFSKVGEALYGPSWRKALSEALGVGERTVRRWQNGGTIPDGVALDMVNLCHKHAEKLTDLAHGLY